MAIYKIGHIVEKIKISIDEIHTIFSKISDDNIRLLGFDPSRTHPKNLILTVLPVIPPRSRPFIIAENSICDDDLTISLSEIIKVNNNLISDDIFDSKRQKYIQTLIFRIKTLFDNTSSKARHTNSRPLKGIKERICGKDGLVRNNLLGKRTDYSARTVISPDPSLRLNEIGIPMDMINTYPEQVNKWNINKLQNMLWQNKILIIDKKTSNPKRQRVHVKFAMKSDNKHIICKLQIGDIVHRQIQNGDIVLLNRQPTLHKGSMLAKKIIRMPGKTIRLNLATTQSYNSDFDGKFNEDFKE
jgi:DNA-directed RNA polymerase beta' subunit